MARHGFGRGEYRYFAYPLPDPVQALRTRLYPRSPGSPIAGTRGWGRAALPEPMPNISPNAICRTDRPTPLLLRYGPGDYNCLHQDLYGAHVFPLQAAVLLSRPGAISPAASSSSPNSARACSRAPQWCR
jgi:hypothetical protein